MATPKPLYCLYCDGFLGRHVYTEGNQEPRREAHKDTHDCLTHLQSRISVLESEVLKMVRERKIR